MKESLPAPKKLVKLQGEISNLSLGLKSANFVMSEKDQKAMGALGAASGLAGLGGQAAIMASYSRDVEEFSDFVEFDLNGEKCKGWLWRGPFKNGDVVEVIAERKMDHYLIAAIARPRDRTISLHPHCSRGRHAHYRNAFKWWIWFGLVGNFVLAACLLVWSIGWSNVLEASTVAAASVFGLSIVYGFAALHIARRWMPFVHVAEVVFGLLGARNPEKVDLVQFTKTRRKPNDPPELGAFYFKY